MYLDMASFHPLLSQIQVNKNITGDLRKMIGNFFIDISKTSP